MKITWKEFNTVSNYLSLSRFIILLPILSILDEIETDYVYRLYAFGLMMLSAATDMLDGYFARKLNQVTEFGKIIDPLADKISYALIVIKLYMISAIPDFFFWAVIIRDLYIFTGGLIVTKIIGKVLPSNLLGKITVLVIGAYFTGVVLNVQQIEWLHSILLYSSTLLIVVSAIGYTIRGVESVRYHRNGSL
ncbi:MAG: CDP-alcohol phosphatidyltransferase family protein [Melioribacteraceae bacterium]|nr:CDP-alcohol phosphatidyltransferase family protein [Melioribacteraceae bacterium]MCF8264662.1 CDP-alcohol phosphatidyltransferase family protein [Melioribacteraceae bacterium]MCF8412847.1 CDP-alcohol phosphatidyltransferase family protein [Melioribacteraceae bacterium]MCF8432101.1 CDP-alcohol phosphatidyltransferase family protein [Melioribacteraceae bacterium]